MYFTETHKLLLGLAGLRIAGHALRAGDSIQELLQVGRQLLLLQSLRTESGEGHRRRMQAQTCMVMKDWPAASVT
jgi:hypothetical protein